MLLKRLCRQSALCRRHFRTEEPLLHRCAARGTTTVNGSLRKSEAWHPSRVCESGKIWHPPLVDLFSVTSWSPVLRNLSTVCSTKPCLSLGVLPVLDKCDSKMRRTYASSNDINAQKKRRKKETTLNLFTLLSENHEEVADTDQVPVLKELVEEREKMTLHMRRCSYALFAVGATQLAWGGFMFFALETPLNHAVLTEICMSALVICGLAYQLKQAVKPVQLFTDMDDFQKTKSIFLSRQITRMLGAFFHRGYGIAFVLSFTLGAHALTCIRFLM